MREDARTRLRLQSGSIYRSALVKDYDGGGRARLGALFCMQARVARLLRFDSTSGHGREHHLDVPLPISLCPSARAVRRIEIFLRT
jgi:hypothetical protein